MPRTIRFHLDEDVNPVIARELRKRDIDVTTSQEAGLLGTVDGEQIASALVDGRVLVTQDNDHLRLHAQGVAHSGIANCHRQNIAWGICLVVWSYSGRRVSPMI
ncbi:DUF5615 family PIN-like protein [Paludisphaera rhizosphaerae]|uniref:DUF5615 family PIN-like protein n=1 Tax=Paludisphaera rhizosphaerae TaxID=2711216 RepID=UPI0013EA4601